MMPRDVATRWNYTYEMLNFAYTYRVAFNELTYQQSRREDEKIRDRRLRMGDCETAGRCSEGKFQIFDLIQVSYASHYD